MDSWGVMVLPSVLASPHPPFFPLHRESPPAVATVMNAEQFGGMLVDSVFGDCKGDVATTCIPWGNAQYQPTSLGPGHWQLGSNGEPFSPQENDTATLGFSGAIHRHQSSPVAISLTI